MNETRDERPARPRDRHGLPGRPVFAQPLDAHQGPDEAAYQARRHPQRRGASASWWASTPKRTLELLPARAFRRPASARPHRHGADPRPQGGHRRRAHDGPRRHGAEPGHRAAEQAPEGARLRHGLREPRPGAGGRGGQLHHRHVRRPGRGAGPGTRHPVPPRSTSTPAACWALCSPSRQAATVSTRFPARCPRPADFPEGDRFTPRSSHPDAVSKVRPVLKRVPGTDHYYAELPDEELRRLGIEPYTAGGAR